MSSVKEFQKIVKVIQSKQKGIQNQCFYFHSDGFVYVNSEHDLFRIHGNLMPLELELKQDVVYHFNSEGKLAELTLPILSVKDYWINTVRMSVVHSTMVIKECEAYDNFLCDTTEPLKYGLSPASAALTRVMIEKNVTFNEFFADKYLARAVLLMKMFHNVRVNVTLSLYSTRLHLTLPGCIDYVAMPCGF